MSAWVGFEIWLEVEGKERTTMPTWSPNRMHNAHTLYMYITLCKHSNFVSIQRLYRSLNQHQIHYRPYLDNSNYTGCDTESYLTSLHKYLGEEVDNRHCTAMRGFTNTFDENSVNVSSEVSTFSGFKKRYLWKGIQVCLPVSLALAT